MHVAIVQLLIESSRWIGHVPLEVCTLSATIQGDLAHARSMETVLDGSKNLPSRYVSNKDKKQRTSSISGKWMQYYFNFNVYNYRVLPSYRMCVHHYSSSQSMIFTVHPHYNVLGLVLGLGNRLLSKGGVVSESGDSHVTSVKRRTSMKRHSSADDLICNESTKRR